MSYGNVLDWAIKFRNLPSTAFSAIENSKKIQETRKICSADVHEYEYTGRNNC